MVAASEMAYLPEAQSAHVEALEPAVAPLAIPGGQAKQSSVVDAPDSIL